MKEVLARKAGEAFQFFLSCILITEFVLMFTHTTDFQFFLSCIQKVDETVREVAYKVLSILPQLHQHSC